MTNKMIQITPDPDLADEAVWYKEKLVEYLHAAREAVNAQDTQSVQTIGHRMKGSAGSFGFDQAGEIGKTLELDAKNNDIHAIKQALALLADYLDKVEIVSN
jgi:HPt (histidine-containing phosphotransfer) domain-containing protein